MVFFLVVFVVRSFHVGFVGRQMVMVIHFGSVPFLLFLRLVKILNFMISSEWITDIGLVVYFGTVGFLVFLVSMEPPLGLLLLLIVPVLWLSLRLAGILLVSLLRGAPLWILMLLKLPLCFLIILMSGLTAALFLIGLLVCPLLVLVSLLISLLPVGIIGVGVMLIRLAPLVVSSVAGFFFAVPGPFQSVQRTELWSVILALQSSGAVHLGVDNLGVVRHVGGLLDGRRCSVPFELVKKMIFSCSLKGCCMLGALPL